MRGRSHTLKINYRTSHRIRLHADRLLPPEIATFEDSDAEADAVAAFVRARLAEGMAPREIGIFVRSRDALARARQAVAAAAVEAATLTAEAEPGEGRVAVGTMHLAKGLAFRAVAVMACDDDVLPLQERVEAIADEGDLDEVYATERHLLYVACTRARERLFVTGVGVPGRYHRCRATERLENLFLAFATNMGFRSNRATPVFRMATAASTAGTCIAVEALTVAPLLAVGVRSQSR